MKYLKTKTEKREAYADAKFDEISERLETEKSVEILLDRDDFKSELSTDLGFGWQDLKEKNKILAQMLMENYNVKILPVNLANMEIKIIVKNKK